MGKHFEKHCFGIYYIILNYPTTEAPQKTAAPVKYYNASMIIIHVIISNSQELLFFEGSTTAILIPKYLFFLIAFAFN